MILLSCLVWNAQAQDKFIDHLAVGVNYGTTSMSPRRAADLIPFGRQTDGFGLEAGAQFTDWLDVRAGISVVPSVKGSQTNRIEGVPDGNYIVESVQINHRTGLVSGNVFFDFYPFRNTTFHFTAGAYAGTRRLLHMYGSTPIPDALAEYNVGVAEIHGLTIPTDKDGEIDAAVMMPAVRPYVGVGVSSARMDAEPIYVTFDLGVMYKGDGGMMIAGPDGKVEVDYWRSEHYISRMAAWSKKCVVAPLLSLRFFVRIF